MYNLCAQNLKVHVCSLGLFFWTEQLAAMITTASVVLTQGKTDFASYGAYLKRERQMHEQWLQVMILCREK